MNSRLFIRQHDSIVRYPYQEKGVLKFKLWRDYRFRSYWLDMITSGFPGTYLSNYSWFWGWSYWYGFNWWWNWGYFNNYPDYNWWVYNYPYDVRRYFNFIIV